MDENTRLREEAMRDANRLNATIIDNLISAHVAATLTAPLLREGMSAKGVVDRYREILTELRIDGPNKGT